MIGRTLAHYRIDALLGAGGMGEVYRATDTKLGRAVALKVLPPDMAGEPGRLVRFEREARAVAALNHPNIVTLYSVEHADDVHFLTMELVEGRSLADLVRDGGLTLDQAIALGSTLAEALAAAHDKAIVHRDLKPANVMVTADGRPKVLDFGLARELRTPNPGDATLTSAGHTEIGVVMGTPPYMSPEQLAGRPVDHRTDIFSLGVMLYEMCSGRRPFGGASAIELASAILRDSPAPIESLCPDVPADLARLLGRCLEKDPQRRVQTARDVANELREIARSTSVPRAITAGRVRTAVDSGTIRAGEGFWIAVLPFAARGSSGDLSALAEGLSEEITAGLSRFSYLRVIARASTLVHAAESRDVRTVGQELGARYVMEGSIRQAGPRVRVGVQLLDAVTGAHLWAETYDRAFDPEQIFTLQDDLIPRIVSTCADQFGVLARSISDAVRGKDAAQLTPYEALMRGFGYHHRLSATEHAQARDVLEHATEASPSNAECHAMLSWIYSHEHGHGFNPRPGSLDRALAAARRAVDLAPSNPLACQTLAVVLFFRREFDACLEMCEKALALNPLDASNEAIFLIAFMGDWDRGGRLIRRAMDLNPHHPGWYRGMLAFDEYRRTNYRAAIREVIKADVPGLVWGQVVLAAAWGQLGDPSAARTAVRELVEQNAGFAASATDMIGRWFPDAMTEHLVEGLRKAGLDIPER